MNPTTAARPPTAARVVNSYNEWDPLEEVIVGVMDGACVPPWHLMLQATLPSRHWDFFKKFGGQPFPPEMIAAANRDLERLAQILEGEGVTVRRPERGSHARPFSTPDWSSAGGLYAAMPRDLLLVVGDEILETPMPWRSRYFEVNQYRPLLKHYFREGARWSSAPKPELTDALFDPLALEEGPAKGPYRWLVNDFEPTFDAADFIRCGRDIFYFKSHVTNAFGVEWLSRHLGDAYRIHELHCEDAHRMHIDTTFLPLAAGKMMVNPDRVKSLPAMFSKWEMLKAPAPCSPDSAPLYFSGKWLSMNVLSIDEKRVVVAEHETNLISSLKAWGFTPIPCPFLSFYAFGGSIHCATLDVRRKGTLQSYF